jgi:hypothetical protein
MQAALRAMLLNTVAGSIMAAASVEQPLTTSKKRGSTRVHSTALPNESSGGGREPGVPDRYRSRHRAKNRAINLSRVPGSLSLRTGWDLVRTSYSQSERIEHCGEGRIHVFRLHSTSERQRNSHFLHKPLANTSLLHCLSLGWQ